MKEIVFKMCCFSLVVLGIVIQVELLAVEYGVYREFSLSEKEEIFFLGFIGE